MALGTTLSLQSECDRGDPVFPASFSSPWIDAIDTGGADDLDNSGTITNPDSHITASTRKKFNRNKWIGTNLVFRLVYDASATISAACTIKVFGRCGTQPWQLLRTKLGATTFTFSASSEDTLNTGETLKYTIPNLLTDTFDMCGCDEFIVGVTVAHNVSAGSAALAKVEVKAI